MQQESSESIKICNHHEKQVPLIWTFVFPGAEYWCPYCGYTEGMFGAGVTVPATSELLKSIKEWEKKSEDYLMARGTFSCSTLEYEGKRIKPSELPSEVLVARKKIIDDWKYEHKPKKVTHL